MRDLAKIEVVVKVHPEPPKTKWSGARNWLRSGLQIRYMWVRVPSRPPKYADVGQLVESLRLERRCWGFESLHPHQKLMGSSSVVE